MCCMLHWKTVMEQTTETALTFSFLSTEGAFRTSVMVLSEKSDSEQEDKE